MRSTPSHRLDAHDAEELAVVLVAPEAHARGDLAVELVRAHVRLVPAVRRDHAAVGLRGGVDDRQDRLALVVAARDGRSQPRQHLHEVARRDPLGHGARPGRRPAVAAVELAVLAAPQRRCQGLLCPGPSKWRMAGRASASSTSPAPKTSAAQGNSRLFMTFQRGCRGMRRAPSTMFSVSWSGHGMRVAGSRGRVAQRVGRAVAAHQLEVESSTPLLKYASGPGRPSSRQRLAVVSRRRRS